MASAGKKSRLSPKEISIEDIFTEFPKENVLFQELRSACDHLYSTAAGAFVSLTINQCNAAYGKYGRAGKSFSQAEVDVKTNDGKDDPIFYFGTLFRRGFDLLYSYLDQPGSFLANTGDSNLKFLLSKLLFFLLAKDEHESVKKVVEDEKWVECDLVVRLAEHFFSKLCVSSTYTVDEYYKSNWFIQRCLCDCGTDVKNHYGDNSIGNKKVWHGFPEILLGDNLLPVSVIQNTIPNSSFNENSAIELRNRDYLETEDATNHLVAQTIVSSFLQKKIHKEDRHSLFPSVGVNRNNIIFYLYDSEHDILLKSPSFSIFHRKSEMTLLTTLATWFVVNYKYLCSDSFEEVITKAKTANFFELANCYLPVYKEELSFRGLSREKREGGHPYQPWFLYKCEHVKPPPHEIAIIRPDEMH